MAQTLFPNPVLDEGATLTTLMPVNLCPLPGGRIIALRRELRLPRSQAAHAIGIHPSTLRRAEQDKDIRLSNATAIINWLWVHGAYAFEVRPANRPADPAEASEKEG